MTISKNSKNRAVYTIQTIHEEILTLKKFLINLRIEKKVKTIKQTHLFKQTKKTIAYLNFQKALLKINKKN